MAQHPGHPYSAVNDALKLEALRQLFPEWTGPEPVLVNRPPAPSIQQHPHPEVRARASLEGGLQPTARSLEGSFEASAALRRLRMRGGELEEPSVEASAALRRLRMRG